MNALVFSRTTQGTYDPATDTYGSPTITTIPGEGILKSGDPEQYAAMGLVLEKTPLFVFAPQPYPLRLFTPEMVQPGDTVVFNGTTYTVVRIPKVVGPDGFCILAYIAATA